ncbi:DUF2550 domain-containing protein [Micromonospora sp. PLK6-60]|uniref:DUF2550 family protein n=1 Tax=Micromonospora sp. PLK6-60 TaxID=2873383 RepID=UPI001CA6336C|nr:DUF2550 domain-containing protein [Micromonospora sp. PLK6-60]
MWSPLDLVADTIGDALGTWLGRLFRASDGERYVAAAYRDRSRRGLGGRWRHGHLRRTATGLEWVPDRLRSIRRTPVALTDIRIVGERDLTLWEHLPLSPDLKVLRCQTRNGPVELAAGTADVQFVRAIPNQRR